MNQIERIKELLYENNVPKKEILTEGALTDFFRKMFGSGFKSAVAHDAETTARTIINDFMRNGKTITLNSLRNNDGWKNSIRSLADEAARIKYKVDFKTLSMTKNALIDGPKEAQKILTDVSNGMKDELTIAAKEKGAVITDDVTKSKLEVNKMTSKVSSKTAVKKELDDVIKTFTQNVKLSSKIGKFESDIGRLKPMKLKQFEKTLVDNSKNVTTTTIKNGNFLTKIGKTVYNLTKEQILKLPGKVIVYAIKNPKKTIALVGGLAAAYYIYQKLNPDSSIVLTDENGNPLTDNDGNNGNEWMECVQKLIANKTGILGSSASGEISVTVTNSQYPKGINFYTNGRVFDVATGKKGTYKCKGGQIQQTNEQLDINEQGNEISQQQMASYVDDAVDDLDGYVAVYNLNNLKSYLTALKGKTYKGKDAIQAFLEFYKEDEGGDDFIKDVQSVGVKTLGVDGIEAKKDVLNLLQSSSTTTTPSSSSLDGIEFTWDAATGTGGGNKGGGKESIYIDCSDDEFPIKFGCRKSPKIKQVQICFGFEQKYQTGNFGPITQKKLQDEYGQIFKSLDEETYNDIINNKCGKTTEPGQDIQIDPSTGRFKDDIFGKYKYNSKDRLQKIGNSNAEKTRNNTSINEKDGETLYNELIDKGYFDSGKIGDNRIKYKGPDLSEGEFNTLTNYFKSNGYYNSKKKDKGSQYVEDKSYKYVWLKSN